MSVTGKTTVLGQQDTHARRVNVDGGGVAGETAAVYHGNGNLPFPKLKKETNKAKGGMTRVRTTNPCAAVAPEFVQ